MKIVCVLLFFLLINSCNSQNKADIITISYKAITRGGSIEINATSELITYKDLENKKQLKPTSGDWKNLINLIEEINLSEMENFNPPSEDRYVDAALQATISITVSETTYNSQTFDHGNPPKELKEIIDKLFDIVSE